MMDNRPDAVCTTPCSVDAAPGPMPVPVPAAQDDPAPAAPETAGLVEQLQQLAALHAQGMLTAEEFGIAKAKLLGTSPWQDETPQPW